MKYSTVVCDSDRLLAFFHFKLRLLRLLGQHSVVREVHRRRTLRIGVYTSETLSMLGYSLSSVC